jgi:carboxypeptidase family protein/cupin domain
MRIVLLLSFLIASQASAQTPNTQKPASTPPPRTGTPPAQPAPAQPAPAQPQPARGGTPPPAATPPAAPRRAAAPTTRGGIAVTVTSPQGGTLSGVRVLLSGPTERADQTNSSGQVSLPSLLTGTYRVRFEGDTITPFEKEVTVQTGRVTEVDVMLNPAPEPKVIMAPAPAPTASGPPIGPKGQPVTLGVVALLEKEFVKDQPRRESLLACSGNERTTMIQLNKAMPERLYEQADAVYYVLGGEGSVQLDGKNSQLATYDFVSVPRGTSHAFTNRGKRALVLLAVLSGEPCEQPK